MQMIYMGSKRRVADEILPIILKGRKSKQWYVEPFCGGCNTLERVTGNRIGGDVHPELIAMLQALQNGWEPPKYINEDDYRRIKVGGDSVLKGYAGFTHSFGGTYFGTYRRNDNGGGTTKKVGAGSVVLKSNYDNMRYIGQRSYDTMTALSSKLKGVRFYNCSYYSLDIPSKSIVYCDPPYAGTRAYKTAKFNSRNFWHWCRGLAEDGHTIFVSEYSAPVDFKCIWSKEIKENLRAQGSGTVRTEKLFTL